MDTQNGRRSSLSTTRPSIDGDWRVRESGPTVVPDNAFKSAWYRSNPGQRQVPLPRSGSSQSNSSEEDSSSQSNHSESNGKVSEHAAMNAKRMSMDPAPYDFNDPLFSTDEFRVWEMKIRNCPKSRPHDWTCCPFAHPGEKAKRRDPRLFSYCGTACADYRKSGTCARGDSCMYAHGVFECWLHPSRYRTQLCTDGEACNRRVCFFAHRECELRKPVGGQMAAIPQPGVNILETLGIMSGNGKGGMMSHADIAEAQRRASMGAMPPMGSMGSMSSLPGSQRTSMSSMPPMPPLQAPSMQQVSPNASLSAAIQMLDPVSKHRLLEALQNDLHETASQSSFYGASNAPYQDPTSAALKSAQVADSRSLLEAIQQLQLGARMSRHSLDDITPILSGHGGVGGIGGRHASGLPQYNPSQSQAHQYLSSISSSRKSVDIGAVSRLAAGADGFSAGLHSSRQVPTMGGSPSRHEGPSSARVMSNRNSVDLGSLYESSRGTSTPLMNPAQAALMQAFASADGTMRSSSDPFGHSPTQNGSLPRRVSISDNPRMSLGKIPENPHFDESNSDGNRSGGSSSVATVGRSSSEASSMASQLASGAAAGNNGSPKKFQRDFSVDNLLAELPRSASQVDLVNNGNL